jgi:hypothetical protein
MDVGFRNCCGKTAMPFGEIQLFLNSFRVVNPERVKPPNFEELQLAR